MKRGQFGSDSSWKSRNGGPFRQVLYFFLGRSDKGAALPMQKLVAGEVLPSIRKTGSYGVHSSTCPSPCGRYIRKSRKSVDLLAPPPPQKILIVQLHLSGPLAKKVKALMDRYGLEQAAVVRMLMVDGLEVRERRYPPGP